MTSKPHERRWPLPMPSGRPLPDTRPQPCRPASQAPRLRLTSGASNMAVRLAEKPVEPARKLFGTDGIRGTANVYPMTSELMLQLGRAVAHQIKRGNHRHRIVIGKDTRLSGYMLETALASGLCSMGVDVLLCGPLPTPAISQLTVSMRADAGAVISASHNPYQDNGIKFFSADGFKLPDEIEADIEDLIANDMLHHLRPTATSIGKAFRIDDAVMAICGLDLLKRKALPKKTLVATVMSNMGLDQAIEGAGGRVVRTRVGDRYVVEELRNGGYTFGGEQSGHLIFLDNANTGDGTVAALALLSVMQESGKPISELAKCMEVFPQAQLGLQVSSKPELGSLPGVMRAIRDVEKKLGPKGRVLVRYSGTEPKVRVLVEGSDQKTIDNYAQQIAGELKKAIGA